MTGSCPTWCVVDHKVGNEFHSSESQCLPMADGGEFMVWIDIHPGDRRFVRTATVLDGQHLPEGLMGADEAAAIADSLRDHAARLKAS